MTEWIKCSDRLPEKGGRYLVYEKKKEHFHNAVAYNYPLKCCAPNIAYYEMYCRGWQWDSYNHDICNPTHWLPLPNAPKD